MVGMVMATTRRPVIGTGRSSARRILPPGFRQQAIIFTGPSAQPAGVILGVLPSDANYRITRRFKEAKVIRGGPGLCGGTALAGPLVALDGSPTGHLHQVGPFGAHDVETPCRETSNADATGGSLQRVVERVTGLGTYDEVAAVRTTISGQLAQSRSVMAFDGSIRCAEAGDNRLLSPPNARVYLWLGLGISKRDLSGSSELGQRRVGYCVDMRFEITNGSGSRTGFLSRKVMWAARQRTTGCSSTQSFTVTVPAFRGGICRNGSARGGRSGNGMIAGPQEWRF